MFRKLQLYAATEPGTKAMAALAAIGCSAGAGAYLIPQGILLDKCVEVFQLHKDGFPVKLPESLEDFGKQVLEQTLLTPKQKEAVKFFNVCGFDTKTLGSTSSKKGAAVGIPKSFSFTSTEDVEKNEIQIDHKDVSWSSEDASHLKQSLILSENAKKFALAREIYNVSYPKLHIHGIGTSAVMLSTIQLAQWGHKKFFPGRPFKIRAVWYSLSCLFGWALWIAFTDMSNVYFDEKCDNLAADLGKDYVSGGVEFYQKKMKQNSALRTLMGTKGENYYTAHGNYNTLFRTKSVPLSQRLDNMKWLLKEAEEKLQKETQELES